MILPRVDFSTKCTESATIYSELSELDHGYPLWTPEGADGTPEIEIGDVGYISKQGAFTTLFNINQKYKTDSKLCMQRFLPPELCVYFDFDRLENQLLTFSNYMSPDVYVSHNVKAVLISGDFGKGTEATIAYSSEGEQGALLWLPQHACLTCVESCTLRDYIKEHIETWHTHIAKWVSLRLQDLVVVRGTLKTPQYLVAAIHPSTQKKSSNNNASVLSLGSSGNIHILRHDETVLVDSRSSLAGEGNSISPEHWATIFLKYYRAEPRSGILKKIKPVARPHILSDDEDPTGSSIHTSARNRHAEFTASLSSLMLPMAVS